MSTKYFLDTNLLTIADHSIHEWRDLYQDHSMHFLQINDFFKSEAVDCIYKYLSDEAHFESVYGVRNVEGHSVERGIWEKELEEERFFFYEQISDLSVGRMSKNFAFYLKAKSFFASSHWMNFAAMITNLSLQSVTSASVHRMHYEHYLRPHHDRGGSRRIAFILYLTPNWKKEFGGQLCITPHNGEPVSIEPVCNSLILFDVNEHKEHHVQALTPHVKELARFTIGGWLNL